MVFDFFKRKAKPKAPKGAFDFIFAPFAMAQALLDVTLEYAGELAVNCARFPIHKQDDASVVEVWGRVRLEACIPALHFGNGSLLDLADVAKQRAVLNALLDDKVHLRFPQPSGEPIEHSIQAMWQVYLYLGQVGGELFDPMTEAYLLKKQGKEILSDLLAAASDARVGWEDYLAHRRSDPPKTLFDLFFSDLNRKTKSIALAKVFGPTYETEIDFFIEEVRKEVGADEATYLRLTMDEILASATPDEAAGRTASLSPPL